MSVLISNLESKSDESLLTIVQNQRDRFRARALELEAVSWTQRIIIHKTFNCSQNEVIHIITLSSVKKSMLVQARTSRYLHLDRHLSRFTLENIPTEAMD